MEFLITTLGWRNWLLLISALINLCMAIFIFSRGVKKNKVNLYFSLLTFFCFTWALGLLLSRMVTDLSLLSLFSRSTYISALCIVLALLYFSWHFSYFDQLGNKKFLGLIWLFFIILSFLVYSDKFITSFILSDNVGEYIGFFYFPGYLLFFIYFLFIAGLALVNIFKKYKILDGVLKKHLLLLFITLFIGLIFGIYFDLFLLIFQDFRFNWFGPVFTIFMNSFVFYLIFFKRDK